MNSPKNYGLPSLQPEKKHNRFTAGTFIALPDKRKPAEYPAVCADAMDSFTVIALLIILTAVFSYLNERFVQLPGTIGVVTLSVIVSMFILVFGKTRNSITDAVVALAGHINFSNLVLNILLGFLLFASALQFNYRKLRALRRQVLLLSTLGVIISAFAFAG